MRVSVSEQALHVAISRYYDYKATLVHTDRHLVVSPAYLRVAVLHHSKLLLDTNGGLVPTQPHIQGTLH